VNIFKKINFLAACLLLSSVVIFTNCEDDNNSLGLNIQPEDDKLNVEKSDTTSIYAYSQLVDSIKTDETSLSLLGSFADPVFGVTTASFYTQFRLGQAAFSYGIDPVPDSLVLAFDYAGFYGDSAAPMTIKVYELDEQILLDSVYYSHQTRAIKSTLLAEKTFVPNFVDSVAILGDTLRPHLRINLTDITASLALKLINAPADSMADNGSFLNFFYGLYLTVEPVNSGGSILYLSLVTSLSEMKLYYHNVAADSLSFEYLLNSNCGRFGHFEHDYSVASPGFISQVIEKDTALGQSICYVQALAGVKTFLHFPAITNYYADGKIAINEARLFLSCAEGEPLLDPATQLIMVKKNSEGGYDFLEDQLIGEGYFGGYYDDDNNGYWFRITSTIQDLMRSEDPDYGFEIYLSGGSVNAQRVLLHGPQPAAGSEDKRMKLVLTYTTLN
jgi:hypothetical protein